MAEMMLYRTAGPVTVDDAGDGLTVIGMAAPYGQVADVEDPGSGPYLETYDRGAFDSIISRWPARKLKVQLEHPVIPGEPVAAGMGAWVGRGAEWIDGPDGLRVRLRLDDTHDGHAAAFKVRDGQTPAMSMSFVPGMSRRTRDHQRGADVVHRVSVRAIGHVALVPVGAYPGALVESVRSAPTGHGAPCTPRLDRLQDLLATLRP